MRLSRLLRFIAIVQSILFLAHLAVYETVVGFLGPFDARELNALRIGMAVLSISFITASLLAWRSYAFPARAFYKIAAVWLGTLSFFFWASVMCWMAYGGLVVAGSNFSRRELAITIFGLGALAAIAAVINAAWTRTTRIRVVLPNLPASWRGRKAVLVSDLHLGHVRNLRFIRRIVKQINGAKPDAVFICGDLYDGTAADSDALAQPLSELKATFGAYFVAGNHEEFRNNTSYVNAVRRAGVRVLDSDKVDADGLQIVGVAYHNTTYPPHLQAILQKADIDRGRASILLAHAPDCIQVAEQAGISLQLSGHTHGGQFLPYTYVARRVYKQYVHGLQRFGNMTTFTTWGAGTWGPPMRLGTKPEIVAIEFE